MLSLQAEAVMLDLDGGGAPEVPLGECNRRSLADANGSQADQAAQSASWRYLEAAPGVTLPTNMSR